MRLIDADALQNEYKQSHEGKRLLLIDVAPTIEPEPKKGRWMLRNADSGFHTDCVCSECKSRHAIGWNFCPNCGASMKEGDLE